MVGSRATSDKAVLDLTRSFVVQGAAGSGKSELAFQRYLVALGDAKQPEEVLFLAADESSATLIRQRVAAILRGEGGDAPVANRDAEANWSLLEQPERLQIHTIGSLSLALVAAAPVSSGCGAGARITANPDAYYRTAARGLLRTLDHDERVAPNLESLLLHLDNDLLRAERLLAGMLRRRAGLNRCLKQDEPGDMRNALQSALEDAVLMTLSDLSGVIPDEVAEELVNVASVAGKQLSIRGSDSPLATWRDLRSLPPADAEHLTQWRGLCELLLTEDGSIRQEFGEEQGLPSPDGAEEDLERKVRTELHSQIANLAARLTELRGFTPRLAAVRDLSVVKYTHLQWTVLQSLLAVLPGAMNNLSRAFSALGEVDLTEIVLGAIRALKSSQAEIFGAQGLRHLIVDNMVDYSFTATMLVERLTQSWTGQDNRSLFITGDAYASIGRSRGAQPALFLKVLNNGLGKCDLSLISLTEQRRSGSEIVDWINNLFGLGTEAVIGEGGMPYLPAKALSDQPGDVQLHAVSGSLADESRQIAKLLTERPELLEGTVAVLLAEAAGAASIVDELHAAGISCRSHAVDLLGQRSVIADLHALTRALCHLSDRVAWLTVLRAPWCGLTLEDLHHLTADADEIAVWELLIDQRRRSGLSEDGQQRLSRTKRVIAQTLAERGRRDLRRLVEGVWTALGGAVCIRSQYELERTRDYFRMLEEIDDGGEPDSLEALDAAVARLCAGLDTITADAGSVFVTTVEKAEQQEFGTVILAGVSTSISLPEDDDALRWLIRPDQFGNEQLLLAPVSSEGGGDAINHWVKSLQTSLHDNELRRVFYSAVARANKHLHVIVRPTAGENGWITPPANSPLAAMWDELVGQLPAPHSADAKHAQTGQHEGSSIRRLPSSWLSPETPQSKAWQTTETQARVSNSDVADLGEDGRVIARVMKRTLFEIASLGPMDWAMRSLDGLENHFQQLFAMMGVKVDDVPGLADRAGVVIRNMLQDDRAKWLLDPNHKQSRSPLRLTGWLDERLIDADIDRSFVDQDEHRWVVGYLFPELATAAEVQVDEAVEKQRAACNDWARLARRFDPTSVRVGLYFPYSGAWREWDPEA